MTVYWLILFIYSSFLIFLTGSQPTSTTKSDHTQTTLNSEVPLEFPEYNQNYTFVDNSSIRENLVSHSGNDTEVEDLLGEDVTQTIESLLTINDSFVVPNPSEEDEDLSQKNATEWIENGDDTEDTKFIIKEVVTKETHNYERGYPVFEGQIAAILAVTFLLFSIVAYGALLSWRRYLEGRYGSREMLVNDDDFMDPDDLKHFSI